MPLPIIAGAAILHGLRIVGLRIIPYLVREGTKIAAKQAAKQTVKKVGTQKITETGYIVVTNNPTKFKLAQKIFGKNRVFKSDTLSAQSTSSRTYEAITKESLKKIKDSSIKRTIASQADDAADGVSRFILNPKSNPAVGGTKVIGPFNKFFGQNIKFTDKTLKNIKLAETGPPPLPYTGGKEIVTTGVVKKTAEKTPKFLREFTGKKTLKTPDVIAIGSGKVKPKINEIVKVKQMPVERPWYVAIVPPWLRTSKSVTQVSRKVGGTEIPLNPYIRTTTEGVKVGRAIGEAAAVSAAIPLIKHGLSSDRPEKKIITDLNIDQLFGGTTGPLARTQLEVPQSVEIFDD